MTVQADAHFVDCDIKSDTISGWTDSRLQARDVWYPSDHSHLNGETVHVVGDGAYKGSETVSGGAVTLDDNTTTNHVGLNYSSTLIPSKLDIEGHGIALVKNIITAIISFYNTLGGQYGDTTADLHPIVFRDRDDAFGSPPSLFTNIVEQPFDGRYEREGNIVVYQNQPLPMTVRGIILPIGVYYDSE